MGRGRRHSPFGGGLQRWRPQEYLDWVCQKRTRLIRPRRSPPYLGEFSWKEWMLLCDATALDISCQNPPYMIYDILIGFSPSEEDDDESCIQDPGPSDGKLSDRLAGRISPAEEPPGSCGNKKGGGMPPVFGVDVVVASVASQTVVVGVIKQMVFDGICEKPRDEQSQSSSVGEYLAAIHLPDH
ncbi:hypothetical protein NE237_027713 [Protea cynaroides]|uniref:Uncharacterized protein n=1 Tax=Protea cynaroides TaxID=273540 RepID=A0A9Q0JT95_9MAGN|nr:hypothetical protein NE237_027713 [Protea cynaroides]